MLFFLYYFYSCLLFVPEGYRSIVKFKTSKTRLYSDRVHFIWQKGIPFNAHVITLPVKQQWSRYDVKKEIVIFNREVEQVHLVVRVRWKVLDNDFLKVGENFSSPEEIRNTLGQIITDHIEGKVDSILKSSTDFTSGLALAETEFKKNLQNTVRDKGLDIDQVDVIRKHIPYMLDLKKIKDLADNLAEFQFMGQYIKENPLILKYLLLQKINKNTSLMITPETFENNERNDKKSSTEK